MLPSGPSDKKRSAPANNKGKGKGKKSTEEAVYHLVAAPAPQNSEVNAHDVDFTEEQLEVWLSNLPRRMRSAKEETFFFANSYLNFSLLNGSQATEPFENFYRPMIELALEHENPGVARRLTTELANLQQLEIGRAHV